MRTLAALALALATTLPLQASAEALCARFFDVGKADATLLSFPSGEHILIDAGKNGDGKQIAATLAAEGVHLRAMVITHFDKDHVGGADQVLDAVPVDEVLIPGYAKESKQHTQFLEALARHPSTRVTTLTRGEAREMTLGTAHLRISAAHRDSYGRDEENDFSLACRLAYEKTRFFFTGDAEDTRQKELLAEGDVACDVLKVPYHGRLVHASGAFLSACAPKIAYIFESEKEPANPALVEHLEKTLGARVFLGSRDGEVRVFSDGTRVFTDRD